MISVMKNIGDEFVDNILGLDYKTLSQSQQRVYDKVMDIVPHMQSTNMISSRIFDQSHLHCQKNKDAPLIRILKKEKVLSWIILFNRINFDAWRQAFAWHQARLSQV